MGDHNRAARSAGQTGGQAYGPPTTVARRALSTRMSLPTEDAVVPGADHQSAPPRRTRRRWLLPALIAAAAIALLVLLAYGVMAQSPNSSIEDALSRGQSVPAPGFRLAVLSRGSLGGRFAPAVSQALGGRSLSLQELRGTPVVLNMWASWCVPCQQEAPTLERAWRGLGRPRGVLFLGLDMQDADLDAQGFMHRYAIDYPNIHDPGNDVPQEYGATGVPETFFISAQGRVVGHVIGVSDQRQLAAGIQAALTGQVAGTAEGGPQRAFR